jgi:hypothetical protein
MKLIKNIIFFSLLFLAVRASGQVQHYSISFDWLENQKNKELPFFEGCFYDGSVPIYSSKEVNSGFESFNIDNVGFESVLLEEKYLLKLDQSQLSNEPKINLVTTSSRKRWSKRLSIFPLYIKNGKVYKVTQIEFDAFPQPKNFAKAGVQTFASESVLREGNGDWYKIQVEGDGMYKIDVDFLESMGIDVSGLNSNHIHIYGNSRGMLPISNSGYRPDDLLNNAILMNDGGDNTFNSNDYLLFYANDANELKLSGGDLTIETNIYSDKGVYFVNINSNTTPKRISTASIPGGVVTHTVNNFHDVKRHESESVNVGKTGSRWYGEHFDTELTRSFSFSFLNADLSQPFKIKAATAAKKTAGSASVKYRIGGTLIAENPVSGTTGGEIIMRRDDNLNETFNPTSSNISVSVELERNSPAIEAWLDYIEINGTRDLKMTGGQMLFRNTDVIGAANIAEYFIQSANQNLRVWDITDPSNAKLIDGSLTGNVYDFKVLNDTLKEFIAFNGGQFFEPVSLGKMEPQNLHGLEQAELLIVSYSGFLTQAVRLANLHRDEGMSVNVVTTEQIYNEFSSGMQDPVAIKQFVKMFYDRAEVNSSLMPVNLCLFGDGSYDPKNRIAGNNYYVPVYEFENSEHTINSMVSDEFFVILDDNESDAGNHDMDMGVGRIIVSSLPQATDMVDKIEHYMKNGSNHFSGQDGVTCDDNGFLAHTGDWKNNIYMVADDESHFVLELEKAYDTVLANYPEVNVSKIYIDAYSQVSTTGGQRFPEVNDLIDRAVEEGSLFINYVGHGGETGWAHERILNVPMINAWNNADNLTTILSATCEFCRFDDATRISAGEYAFLNPNGGAISLFTTTRSVYYNVNDEVLEEFYPIVFKKNSNGEILTMGETLMQTENNMVSTSNNKRSFTLIGDPALRFTYPKNKIVVTHVNGHDIDTYTDTLKALGSAVVKGYVANNAGVKLTSYNGVMYPTIMDKEKDNNTLGQDQAVNAFKTRENNLYKGKVSVVNGDFEFEFIIPKDIDYAFGLGKISTYSSGDLGEASGGETRVYVGGVNPNGINDSEGPQIEMYLNSPNFANGGTTDETPTLIAEVFDENGINTVGNGIGHDIAVILDQNNADQVILNNYYEADLDTYKSGKVNYKFDQLSEGTHTLTFKVWDVNNNSSEETIEFVVRPQVEIAIEHVLNYPNPFTTSTQFFFEHNQICQSLETQVQIFTVSGKLIKTINENVKTNGFRTDGIHWDGKDDFGDSIGRGVYVYKVSVTNPDGSKAEKLEKLVLL